MGFLDRTIVHDVHGLTLFDGDNNWITMVH